MQTAAVNSPVDGNAEGSYTTMHSVSGIVFAACTISSGFAGVFCDQGYWQRAIASRPESTTKAYMFGALSWFAIPWCFGTTMGLSARGLLTNSNFPTFPYALSTAQQSAGLVAPAAAVTLLGKSGAVSILLVTFMAATSAASAELIAIASIIVYDVIGTYWRPLSGPAAVKVSHYVIAAFSIWMGVWATILNKAGIDLGWLFYVQGICLTPAVIPIGLTVCWKKLTKEAAFYGTLFGTTCGLLGWMIGCWKIYGKINVTNLALPYSAISGAAPGLVLSGITTVLITLVKPGDYDWESTRKINTSEDVSLESDETKNMPEMTKDNSPQTESGDDQHKPEAEKKDQESISSGGGDGRDGLDREMLQKVFVRAAIVSWTMALIITIVSFYLLFPENNFLWLINIFHFLPVNSYAIIWTKLYLQ